MRFSCPEPKRSGGATARRAPWTTTRAVGTTAFLTFLLWTESFILTMKRHQRSVLCCVSLTDGGASLADRESSLDLIKLDISRTFPSLFIFQKVTSLFRWTCSDYGSNLRVLSVFSAGGSLPRPAPQCAGGLHLLQTWHRLREFVSSTTSFTVYSFYQTPFKSRQ